MSSQLPVELATFVTRNIASVEQLEILLKLRNGQDRAWTAADLNRELRSNEASVSRWLGVLVSLRLIATRSDGFRYRPETPELDAQIDALSAVYLERPSRVIELIFSQPHAQVLTFAQAFDLRKRP